MKRRFNFLHMYAGVKDPLGKAIEEEAKRHRMKVSVYSCEKENGVDLLKEELYLDFLKKAKEGFWDGMHSGFPTSFSKLRWRKAEGYPGPVRSKRHPYGLPSFQNTDKLRQTKVHYMRPGQLTWPTESLPPGRKTG